MKKDINTQIYDKYIIHVYLTKYVMYFGITIRKQNLKLSWKRILFYHYDNRRSYDDDDDDDDDDNNIDNHDYYHGDELGCSPVLFCSVILKIISTELYKCNQMLKVVLLLHLDDLGLFLL